MLNPQQQAWYQQFVELQHQRLAQQLQTLHGLQPWQQPGYSRMANPLLSPSAIPGYSQADPQAATVGLYNPEMGQVSLGGGGEGVAQGGGMNPELLQLLLTGKGGS